MYHVPVVNEPERVDDSTERRLAMYLAQPREPPHLVAALSPRSSVDAQNGAATLTVRHEQMIFLPSAHTRTLTATAKPPWTISSCEEVPNRVTAQAEPLSAIVPRLPSPESD